MTTLWLGSASPRRAELLRQLQLVFKISAPDINESVARDESPCTYVARMSETKVRAVCSLLAGGNKGVVLCADTVVVLDGEILGKPADERDAIRMLMSLSGRKHSVLTSVSIARTTLPERDLEIETFGVETIVTMRRLSKVECKKYWRSGEPADKAGAYGIQGLGAMFVETVEGSYSNVVGLPLMETSTALGRFGIDCLQSQRL